MEVGDKRWLRKVQHRAHWTAEELKNKIDNEVEKEVGTEGHEEVD